MKDKDICLKVKHCLQTPGQTNKHCLQTPEQTNKNCLQTPGQTNKNTITLSCLSLYSTLRNKMIK